MNSITKYIFCKSRKLCEDIGTKFIENGKISEFLTIVCVFTTISFLNWSMEYLKNERRRNEKRNCTGSTKQQEEKE